MVKFLRRWKIRILLFFAVVGPGFITANVDNDAGGILTYSQAGAQFGHLLLWTMIPITIALIVIQEMCARMGAVTGKGLSDLIREEFGLRITFFMMLGILVINFGNVVTEFIGIATSLELFGLPRMYTVPICGVIVWFIVVKGQYKTVEKVFLVASFFYVASRGFGNTVKKQRVRSILLWYFLFMAPACFRAGSGSEETAWQSLRARAAKPSVQPSDTWWRQSRSEGRAAATTPERVRSLPQSSLTPA